MRKKCHTESGIRFENRMAELLKEEKSHRDVKTRQVNPHRTGLLEKGGQVGDFLTTTLGAPSRQRAICLCLRPPLLEADQRQGSHTEAYFEWVIWRLRLLGLNSGIYLLTSLPFSVWLFTRQTHTNTKVAVKAFVSSLQGTGLPAP